MSLFQSRRRSGLMFLMMQSSSVVKKPESHKICQYKMISYCRMHVLHFHCCSFLITVRETDAQGCKMCTNMTNTHTEHTHTRTAQWCWQ